jgi:hypothetical protein
MPGSSARQVALLLVAGAVVAGCSGDTDKPQTLPTLKAPTPGTSPTSLTTPSIETIKANTPEGAAAFVRTYYAQVNLAASNGQTAPVKQMTAPECPCRALTKYIDDAYKAGSLRGFVYSIRGVKTENFKGSRALVTVLYAVSRIEELNKEGKVTVVVPPVNNGQKAVTVVRVANGWLIDNVQNFGK